MKNFRKVLALVLVVATLFSFVAMTASAKDYTDSDKVSYTEAVDVLSAIGILNGYNDGSYRPANTIKRSEMAKMIAVLSNAGDDISDMYASACKFADMNGDAAWAKSYVAYCNQTGIVAGRNASTFDPEGKVTGVETAKMLLCVLGFDAKVQGYVGTNWKVNVQRDAKNFGLLEDFAADFEMDRAITREEAAQMMLNALKANIVVGTVSDNIVTITNTLYQDQLGVWQISIPDAENEGWIVVTRHNVVISPFPLYTIYKNLDVVDSLDCYGNPGLEWIYENDKGTVVFDEFYPTAPDFTYTDAGTLTTDLKEELDSTAAGNRNYRFVWYVDGAVQNRGVPQPLTTANLDDSRTTNDVIGSMGRGVETKVFVDDIMQLVIITIKNTYIGYVESVSNYEGTFKIANALDPTLTYTAAWDNTEYGFKVGDIVLFWLCSNNTGFTVTTGAAGTLPTYTFTGTVNQMHDAQLAPVVTGTCTRVEVDQTTASVGTSSSTTTVGGKTYSYAKNYNRVYNPSLVAMAPAQVNASTDNGQQYDVYLDTYGNVMAWTRHSNAPQYVYAYAVEQTGEQIPGVIDYTGTLGFTYTNDLVTFDNTTPAADAAVNDNLWFSLNGTADNTNSGHRRGRLVRYEVVNGVATIDNGDTTVTGVYVPDTAATPGTTATYGSDYARLFTGTHWYLDSDGDIKSDSNAFVFNGTDSTKYMVRTWNYTSKTYEYNVYTRDQLTVALAGYTHGNDEIDLLNDRMATIQCFYEEVLGINQLTYVFIDALYQHTADRAFVYSTAQKLVSDDLFVNQLQAGSYVTYKAFINGSDAILAVTDNARLTAGVPWVYNAELQVIGLVDGVTPVYSNVKNVTPTDNTGIRLWYTNGNVVADRTDSYKVASDCYVVVGDPTNSSYTKLEKVEDLNTYFEDTNTSAGPGSNNNYYDYTMYWLFFNDAGEVSEIYIVVNVAIVDGIVTPVH